MGEREEREDEELGGWGREGRRLRTGRLGLSRWAFPPEHLRVRGLGPGGSLWIKTDPDLPRAGGDPSWGPRLDVGRGGLLSSISSQAHVSTPPSRGLLPNGIGQTPFPSVVCRTQNERGREAGLEEVGS